MATEADLEAATEVMSQARCLAAAQPPLEAVKR